MLELDKMDKIIEHLQEIEREFLRGTYKFRDYLEFTNELKALIEKIKL